MSIEIPYYERKTAYGIEKMVMPITNIAQEINTLEFSTTVSAIQNIYSTFRLMWEMEQNGSSKILRNLPVDFNKAKFLRKSFKNSWRIPAPINSLTRLDVVNGKVVDINNKPAGAGLITTVEKVWTEQQAWPNNTLPIRADLKQIFNQQNIQRIFIATQRNYVFSSDQIALAKNIQEQTGIETLVIDPQEQQLKDLQTTNRILCFSYPQLRQTQSGWVNAMFRQPELFPVNPLVSLIWDNKALIALPFLEIENLSELGSKLTDLRAVFPDTFLVREKATGGFEIAKKLTKDGIIYVDIDINSVPPDLTSAGEVYIKPLAESGGRGIVIKKFQDRGGVFQCIKKFATNKSGIVIQKTVAPQSPIPNQFIKDGYFFDSQNGQVITIERMQSIDPLKIHGGSQTELVPVYLKGAYV